MSQMGGVTSSSPRQHSPHQRCRGLGERNGGIRRQAGGIQPVRSAPRRSAAVRAQEPREERARRGRAASTSPTPRRRGGSQSKAVSRGGPKALPVDHAVRPDTTARQAPLAEADFLHTLVAELDPSTVSPRSRTFGTGLVTGPITPRLRALWQGAAPASTFASPSAGRPARTWWRKSTCRSAAAFPVAISLNELHVAKRPRHDARRAEGGRSCRNGALSSAPRLLGPPRGAR